MEVGYERVNALEFVRRIDKNGSIAAARAQKAVFIGDRFQRAHRGGTDGNDPPPFALGGVYDLCRLLAHAIVFRMHDVVRQILFLDGAESAQPHMEQHLRDLHPHRPDLGEQFLREVQPRGGRRGGAVRLAVHRLIAVFVFELFVDIGRQRHRADAGENILEHAVEMKIDDAFARLRPVLNGEGKLFGNDKFRADFRLFAGLYQNFPLGEVAPLQKEHFHFAAVFRISEHARGQYPRVVYHEHVSGFQVLFDVAEDAVFGLSRLSVVYEEAGRIPRLGRRLRDELFGKFIKIIGFFQHILQTFFGGNPSAGFAVSCTHAG